MEAPTKASRSSENVPVLFFSLRPLTESETRRRSSEHLSRSSTLPRQSQRRVLGFPSSRQVRKISSGIPAPVWVERLDGEDRGREKKRGWEAEAAGSRSEPDPWACWHPGLFPLLQTNDFKPRDGGWSGFTQRGGEREKKTGFTRRMQAGAHRRRAALLTRNLDRLEFQLILNYFNDGLAVCV